MTGPGPGCGVVLHPGARAAVDPDVRVGAVIGPIVVLAQVDDALTERIADSVQTILSNPPYVEQPGLVERFLRWLAERGLLPAGAVEDVGSVLGVIIQVVIVAVVVGVLWLVVRRLRRGGVRRRARDHPVTSTSGPQRSAAEWLAEARGAADRGDHRSAVRAAYRALVARLIDLEVVPATPGATVGAHREALVRAEVVADLQARGFDRASDVFERVWYADAQADADDAAVVLAAAEDAGVRA